MAFTQLTTAQVQLTRVRLLKAQLFKKTCFRVVCCKRKLTRRYKDSLRTACEVDQPSHSDSERSWIEAEEAEIAALLEHDFHIETDPRKIEWPPNELRHDPEELRKRYEPHVSYDPVPVSSENLPLLWDTPRVLSLLRLVIYVPFLASVFFKFQLGSDLMLLLSTWLSWLRKKSENFVQSQSTFLTFLEPFVIKSMFWSCLVGTAIEENSLWVSFLILLLIPAESFILALREWTTFCGRRFEAGYKRSIVEEVFEVLVVLALHSTVYLKLWKYTGYCCLGIFTCWRLRTCIHYARTAMEDRQQSEKRTMF
ncbi:hypothetical protein GAYE_SCF13G3416 [Galdieria yellowstonensis]|uniref:Uncharacterized protein n=1 Tax=Galdieria yellowstonensis TaxID=3028027 RepID=A0AAV9IE40_9RHOD|nr:hypothetical protein GAYE_SCF13G3416 [Galdieria yellowstonensis]